ncbi:PQQ-binding-like beta-propeller repeat protein [Nocardia brasiliensis]|uniref:outer membrane protein assembly factor BamB family protein n=1 Tax=Nocardia brasiliensis TaxID=37326 RepID=UPI0018956AD1|nr:PQQ-binding-like beta-propeller repeat protein [Nocardia brasiliensis]MBF6542348.1 PQQ-binding-like beta-propeller repeat protein [Nocardia brasiliensis]
MRSVPGLRGLILAAVAAVLTTAGAVYVLTQPADGVRKITGTTAAAPGLAWSVAATALGEGGLEFRDPVAGTEFDVGGPGFIDAGDTLVTVTGVANGDLALRDPVLVGIDAGSGAVRWRAPAVGLRGCAATPVDSRIVCYANASETSELVGYDIGSGKVSRTPTPWLVFALAATGARVYVAEGDVESDDVRVHAGTFADPQAYWSRDFAMGTAWEDLSSDALTVTDGQGVFALGAGLAGFDLDSGAPTWTAELNGCSRASGLRGAVVERVHTECAGYRVTGSDLLDRTGRVIATTDHAATQPLSIDSPADDTVPVLLADSARDRRTGAVVWTNPDLVTAPRATDTGNTTTGTAIAVAGEAALLRDDQAHTMTGLNMRTGHRLWQVRAERYGTPAAWDGEVVVLSDATGLWAVDPKTGVTVWDIPFTAVDATPEALSDGGQLRARTAGNFLYASARTLIALRPL